VAGFGEHGNELSVSVECDKLLDWLGNYQLLKKDCAAFSYLRR